MPRDSPAWTGTPDRTPFTKESPAGLRPENDHPYGARPPVTANLASYGRPTVATSLGAPRIERGSAATTCVCVEAVRPRASVTVRV